jgi:hypothetical protein
VSSIGIDISWETVLDGIEREVFVFKGDGRLHHNYRAEALVEMLEAICQNYREAETNYAAARRLVAEDAAELARMRLEDAAASIVDSAREATR